jgi:hypothetical protein
MKAIIRKLDKQYLPHNVDAEGRNRLHITTEVDFVNDAGEVVHNQTYAHLPEDFDGQYFQRQANSMQGDIEDLKQRAAREAARAEEEKPADEQIRKFKLEFGEQIQLRDEVNNA